MGKVERRYSVYRVKDDMPIIIYGTSQQCAAALGINMNSFFVQVHRNNQKRGKERTQGKYVIYSDEVEDIEDG